jgi:transposase
MKMISKQRFFEIVAMYAKRQAKKTEYESLMDVIRANKLKRVDKRLQVIRLHMEGRKQQEIADKLGYRREWVCRLLKDYREKGLQEYARHKYGGNHRAMSIEAEMEILQQFEEEATSGRLIVASTIKKAFDKKRGKETGRGYIYMLLKRHQARKITPRPVHPKKASDEVIETSKKLTFDTGS